MKDLVDVGEAGWFLREKDEEAEGSHISNNPQRSRILQLKSGAF